MGDTEATLTPEQEAARKVLQDIYMAYGFGVVNTSENSALLPLLEDGRIVFDPTDDHCEYTLSAPIKLLNKDKDEIRVVRFREPSATEIEYIRAGLATNRAGSVDLGATATATLRALVRTGPLITGLADRIKARDLDTLSGVLGELGFFGR
jgi:hypothetical protein